MLPRTELDPALPSDPADGRSRTSVYPALSNRAMYNLTAASYVQYHWYLVQVKRVWHYCTNIPSSGLRGKRLPMGYSRRILKVRIEAQAQNSPQPWVCIRFCDRAQMRLQTSVLNRNDAHALLATAFRPSLACACLSLLFGDAAGSCHGSTLVT